MDSILVQTEKRDFKVLGDTALERNYVAKLMIKLDYRKCITLNNAKVCTCPHCARLN